MPFSAIKKLPYIGLTIYFYDNTFKLHNYTICIEHMPGNHTGENIREILVYIFEEWEIKDLVIVSDNGRDISKAISLSEHVEHIRCLGNMLNLMVRKVMKKDKNDLVDTYSQYEDEEAEVGNREQSNLQICEEQHIDNFQLLIKKCKK